MDETQERWVGVFGWTAVGVLVLVAGAVVKAVYGSCVAPLFFKSYRVSVVVVVFVGKLGYLVCIRRFGLSDGFVRVLRFVHI